MAKVHRLITKEKTKLQKIPSTALVQTKQFHMSVFRQNSLHLLELFLAISLKTCEGQLSSDSLLAGMFLSRVTMHHSPISSPP